MRSLKWAYGITTVPSRRDNLFRRTVASLYRAGFDRPWIFVDGEKYPYDELNWQEPFRFNYIAGHSYRNPALGVVGNWILSLWELYLREPTADRYAIFQDDLVACVNLREYLERCTYPDGKEGRRRGYWNLYTFPVNERIVPRPVAGSGRPLTGWYEAACLSGHNPPDGLQGGRGAVGLVFNREMVTTILSAPSLVNKPQCTQRGHRAIDGAVVTAVNLAGGREFVHYPSLLQHTGDISAMGNRQHLKSESFPGEDFDALSLLPTPPTADVPDPATPPDPVTTSVTDPATTPAPAVGGG